MTTKFGVSYYGSYHKDGIITDLAEIKQVGFDTVVLAVSENDWNNFRGVVRFTADYAKKLGLEVLVDLWGYAGCFGGEASSYFICTHPDSRQVLNNGQMVPMGCLNSKPLRRFIKDTITDMSKNLHIDGFFIDEPHFFYNPIQGTYACHCSSCSEFAKENNIDIQVRDQLFELKNKSLVSFCDEISSHVKSIDSKLMSVVCIFPEERDPAYNKSDIAALAGVDVIATDPYWKDPAWCSFFNVDGQFVRRTSIRLNSIAKKNNKLSEVWIQGFSIRDGEEQEISRYMSQAAVQGVDRIMVWTYRCGWGSSVASDNPDACWKIIKDAVKSLRTPV